MLCQRCTSLFRASRPTATPIHTAKRALSTSQPIRRRQAQSLSSATASPLACQLPARPAPSTRPSAPFHTSASCARPGASSSSSSSPSAAEPEPSAPPAGALEKPDFLDAAESVVWDRLVKELNPAELVVQDISGGCGSMYGIEISSEKFRGANMLKQQRMVNAVLGDLMKEWHGCQLKTRVP